MGESASYGSAEERPTGSNIRPDRNRGPATKVNGTLVLVDQSGLAKREPEILDHEKRRFTPSFFSVLALRTEQALVRCFVVRVLNEG
ncbi:MAG: hypothetical protein ABI672_18900, partial [Vicinamibacteria bacterium]